MKLLILLLLTTTLGALEIEGLPKEVTVDPKAIYEDQKYEVFNVGYVTRRMQDFGYLNAKVVIQNGAMKAIPGDRYTIRELTIPDGVPNVYKIEIPMTPENMRLFQRIFEGGKLERSIKEDEKAIHLTFVPD